MGNKDTINALLKLAYFEPCFTDEYGNQVIDYLVIDTLSAGDNLLTYSADEIKTIIMKNFTIDFALGEIIMCARRLQSKQYINIINADLGMKN